MPKTPLQPFKGLREKGECMLNDVNIYIYTEYHGSLAHGSGRYHYILETIYERDGKEIPVTLKRSGICEDTTKNRLELLALVESLKHMRLPSNITVYTKSDYLSSSYSNWLNKWINNDFKSKEKQIKHADLWRYVSEQRDIHNMQIIKADKTEYTKVQEMELRKYG